jgi:hypothetical protein
VTPPPAARQAPAAPAQPAEPFGAPASHHSDGPTASRAAPAEPAPYQFTARELARLATYRAAVAAGFYNEGLTRDVEQDAEREAA